MRNCAIRAFVWNALFYLAAIFSVLFLQGKEIAGWLLIPAYLPLLFLLLSGEALSVAPDKKKQTLKPWNIPDFAAKAVAFVIAQLAIYLFSGVFGFVCLAVIVLLAAASVYCEIKMLQKAAGTRPARNRTKKQKSR